jgi:hypothetical protein
MSYSGGRKAYRVSRLAVATLLSGLMLGHPAAAEQNKAAGSLQFIPADAAFYSAMLRNREQIEAIANSKAWAKFKSLPAVQMALQMATAQLQNPQANQFLQMPENQQLISLLGDMVSNEMFIYGGENMVSFVDLVTQVIGATRYGSLIGQLQTAGGEENNALKSQVHAAIKILSASVDRLRFPDVILGFKLSKTEPAEAQLARLEKTLGGLSEQLPVLQGRYEKAKVGTASFLTLKLDGSMLPWDRLPIKDMEEKEGELEPLIKKLQALKLSIAIGVRDGYLLVVIAESIAAVDKLGKGESLAGRPELKPVMDNSDKRLTSISYTSKALRGKVGTSQRDIDSLMEVANAAMKRFDLPAEQREKVRADLTKLANDVKTFVPKLGATVAFSFLTDRGIEGFDYDWTEYEGNAELRALTLLNHVGGSPLLAIVGRSPYSPESYQLLVKWLKKANQYFEELALPKLESEQKQTYERIAKIAHPLLARLDRATGTMLLPSLADGQAALVVDDKLTSKRWHQALPETEKPMAILEPALVVGVSDAALLRKAMAEYRSIANDAIAKLHEAMPDKVPDVQIPEPETRSTKSGTLYFYPLPPQFGVDNKITPNAGLSDHVAVLAISQEHSQRLLAKMPLQADGGPLADLNKPLSLAAYVDCEGFVKFLVPWTEFGVRLVKQRANAEKEQGEQAPTWLGMLDQIPQALQLFEVFKKYTSCTYYDGKALVTHSETLIRDF